MEIALTIGAVAIAAVLFVWLIRIVKSTLRAAFLVGLFLLGLWLAFGIGPMDVWETILNWLPDSLFIEDNVVPPVSLAFGLSAQTGVL